MRLVFKLLLGIVGGLLIGYIFSSTGSWRLNGVRLLITFQSVFGQFIGFVIPLLILFYIMDGIAALNRGAGKLLSLTVGFSYASTLIAGLLAFLVASNLLPLFNISAGINLNEVELNSFIKFKIAAPLEITTALVLAFVFGIGISVTGSRALRDVSGQGKNVIEWVLSKIIIPTLPFYIAAIFAEMMFKGDAIKTLSTFGLVLGMAIIMHWIWLTTLYIITGLLHKKNPWYLIKSMIPAYLTAVGTMSSAATIPMTLSSTKKMGVNNRVADFVIPLCATIHLSGSVITLVSCTVAVILITPTLALPSLAEMIPFLLLLGVTMVAAPGVPGGAVMAALGILAATFGFGEESLALMITLYLAQDSFGTACNVTGDGVIALWIDKFSKDNALSDAEVIPTV